MLLLIQQFSVMHCDAAISNEYLLLMFVMVIPWKRKGEIIYLQIVTNDTITLTEM